MQQLQPDLQAEVTAPTIRAFWSVESSNANRVSRWSVRLLSNSFFFITASRTVRGDPESFESLGNRSLRGVP